MRCLNQVTIQSHCSIDEVQQTDLIIIPPIGGDIDKTLAHNQALIPYLQHHYEQGASIASICTGAFLLAETGLLNEKSATTHWGYVERFRNRYPQIKLTPEKMLTNEVDLFCASGGTAWLDLSHFLVEKYCGHEVTVQTSKALVFDRERQSQAPYTALIGQTHQDEEIRKTQVWMEEHFNQKISVEELGGQFGMSSRTFKRRFKSATGYSPLIYLQTLRVEAAKKFLESTNHSIEEITLKVGYEDCSSFIKLFTRMTSVTPNTYRSKFRTTIS